MVAVSKEYQDELPQLVKDVENTYQYMKPNYDRFNRFRKFVYKTALTDDDRNVLRETGKPDLEVNICEASISKQLGEFAKNQPSIKVSKDDGADVSPQQIKFVEDHGRHIIYDSNKNSCEYETFKDIMSGGFSFLKAEIDYTHEMSSHQTFLINRVYDPTLCGFDPLSITPTKMDGRFVFELHPMSIDDFKSKYPKIKLDKVRWSGDLGGFNWSFSQGLVDIVMVCDFYKKKKKKVQVVTLIDGTTKLYDEYKEAKEKYEADLSNIAQFPLFVGKPRWTTKTTICRYVFIKDEVLEYEETIFKTFPIAYMPGNDMLIRDEDNSTVQLMTRPYVYNLYGVQRLKNFATQCWGNELENMVQHKFMIAEEALPTSSDAMEAWVTPQKPSTLIWKSADPHDATRQIPEPVPVPRVPMPPEIGQAFQAMDQMIEVILGTFTPDNKLGNLSGDSIEEGQIQANMTSMPYIVGWLQGWTHILQCCVEAFPKVYVFPRELPIRGMNGKPSSVKLNGNDGMKLTYGEYDLNVKVEAGVNFNIQKTRALNQIIGLMKVSPVFAKFMNEEGLEILLDNVEIRGIDALKEMVGKFSQRMKQEQADAMKNNPEMKKLELKAQELQLNSHHEMIDDQIETAKLSLQKEELDVKKMQALADIGMKQDEMDTQLQKADAEKARANVDLAMKVMESQNKTREMAHDHAERIVTHHHEKEKHHHERLMAEKKIQLEEKKIKSKEATLSNDEESTS